MVAKPLQAALCSLALPGLLAMTAAPAEANIVTMSFPGTVTQYEEGAPNPFSPSALGDPVTRTVVFDTAGLGPPTENSGISTFLATSAGVISLSDTIGGQTVGWASSDIGSPQVNPSCPCLTRASRPFSQRQGGWRWPGRARPRR